MNNNQRQSSSLFVAATPRKSAMGTSPRKSANHNNSSQRKSKGTPSSSSAKAKPQKKAPQIHQLEEDDDEMVGTSSATANGDRFARERSFPLTKVRHIMQSSPNSDEGIKMSAEAVSAMAMAAVSLNLNLILGCKHSRFAGSICRENGPRRPPSRCQQKTRQLQRLGRVCAHQRGVELCSRWSAI